MKIENYISDEKDRFILNYFAIKEAPFFQQILKLQTIIVASGYSRSTIYLRIAQGLWTKPVSLGPRAVGWPSNEVEALNAARISGKTDTQIRELVLKLEFARKAAA